MRVKGSVGKLGGRAFRGNDDVSPVFCCGTRILQDSMIFATCNTTISQISGLTSQASHPPDPRTPRGICAFKLLQASVMGASDFAEVSCMARETRNKGAGPLKKCHHFYWAFSPLDEKVVVVPMRQGIALSGSVCEDRNEDVSV